MEYFTNITTILQVRTANNTNSYVSFFFFRAVIHVMSNRHSFYKYILVVLAFAVTLEFPRFFEMKFNIDNQYITTDLMENPYYVQFNSYWNELFVTGFVPLFTLCYMNLKMFFKIKVNNMSSIYEREMYKYANSTSKLSSMASSNSIYACFPELHIQNARMPFWELFIYPKVIYKVAYCVWVHLLVTRKFSKIFLFVFHQRSAFALFRRYLILVTWYFD